MLKIVRPPGLVFAGETDEQAEARDRFIEQHNADCDREWDAWRPGPAKFYEGWCRKYAPHLLEGN